MHASVRDHPVFVNDAAAIKPRVVIVSRGASPDAIVTASAAVQVNHHRIAAIDQTLINQKLKRRRVNRRFTILQSAIFGFSLRTTIWQWRKNQMFWQHRDHMLVDDRGRDPQDVHMPHSSKA